MTYSEYHALSKLETQGNHQGWSGNHIQAGKLQFIKVTNLSVLAVEKDNMTHMVFFSL